MKDILKYQKIKKIFFSFYISAFFLSIYALACAFATFIEHKYDFASARALIYENPYFHSLYFLIFISLLPFIYLLIKSKKYVLAFLHFSFLLIIIGASISHFFALDGGIHLKEGEQTNQVFNKALVLKINSESKTVLEKKLVLSQLYSKAFSFNFKLNDKTYTIKYKDFKKAGLTSFDTLKLSISDLNTTKTLKLIKNQPELIEFDKDNFELSFENLSFILPFDIKLKDFYLQRYPGSLSASYFYSDLIFIEKKKNIEKRVGINHFLDYKGYRIFQSAYDADLKGTILALNYDPGKNITYLAYASLILGFLLVIFARAGRFNKLNKYLKKKQAFFLFFVLFFSNLFLSPVLLADENKLDLKEVEQIKTLSQKIAKNTKNIAADFASLLVQDFNGRIKPMDTFTLELMNKMSKKSKLIGLNSNQLFLALMLFPNEFRNIKLIYTKNKEIKKLMKSSSSYFAFNDFFDAKGYKLKGLVEDLGRKSKSKQNSFEKELLKLDERINIASFILSGEAFRVVSTKNSWQSPSGVVPISYRQPLMNFFYGFNKGVYDADFSLAKKGLQELKTLQKKHTSHISEEKIALEIFLNKYPLFDYLNIFYALFSLFLFIYLINSLLRDRGNKKIYIFAFYSFIFAFLLFSLALLFRWLLSTHAPWSDAYESMLFIAFICALAGLIFAKEQPFVLLASSIMSACSLFVAHLGFIDPQITPLVPVLKSPWLNIHVSVITASYGFFSLSFFLGLISLLLFNFKKAHKLILSLVCVNEMSIILGLALLSIGNFLGAVWANESWGRYWGFDAKETWSLISIIVYALCLHLRLMKAFKSPYAFSVGSVLAFFSILMTYFGVNYYLSGLHSYARGDALSLPFVFFAFIILIAFLIILSFFKRKYVKYDF